MVLILDGNSEIGAHMRSDLDYLTCLRHLFRSRAITKLYFLQQKLQDFESLLRESFLRRKGIPPFLFGKPFKHVMEVVTEKYNTLPVALITSSGKLIICPNENHIVDKSDSLLCTVRVNSISLNPTLVSSLTHLSFSYATLHRYQWNMINF